MGRKSFSNGELVRKASSGQAVRSRRPSCPEVVPYINAGQAAYGRVRYFDYAKSPTAPAAEQTIKQSAVIGGAGMGNIQTHLANGVADSGTSKPKDEALKLA